MQVYKYIVHFDEDIVGEDIVHGLFMMGHGYDLIVSVCDSCLGEFENEFKDLDFKCEGIYPSGAYCCYCGGSVSSSDKDSRVSGRRFPVRSPVDTTKQEQAQLVFDFIDNQ